MAVSIPRMSRRQPKTFSPTMLPMDSAGHFEWKLNFNLNPEWVDSNMAFSEIIGPITGFEAWVVSYSVSSVTSQINSLF